jgi:hypothetical protein
MKEMDVLNKMVDIVLAYRYEPKPKKKRKKTKKRA